MNFKDDFAIVAEAVKKQGNAMHIRVIAQITIVNSYLNSCRIRKVQFAYARISSETAEYMFQNELNRLRDHLKLFFLYISSA